MFLYLRRLLSFFERYWNSGVIRLSNSVHMIELENEHRIKVPT